MAIQQWTKKVVIVSKPATVDECKCERQSGDNPACERHSRRSQRHFNYWLLLYFVVPIGLLVIVWLKIN